MIRILPVGLFSTQNLRIKYFCFDRSKNYAAMLLPTAVLVTASYSININFFQQFQQGLEPKL